MGLAGHKLTENGAGKKIAWAIHAQWACMPCMAGSWASWKELEEAKVAAAPDLRSSRGEGARVGGHHLERVYVGGQLQGEVSLHCCVLEVAGQLGLHAWSQLQVGEQGGRTQEALAGRCCNRGGEENLPAAGGPAKKSAHGRSASWVFLLFENCLSSTGPASTEPVDDTDEILENQVYFGDAKKGHKEVVDNVDTTVLLPCLVMLQRVSRSYKGHQISEKFDTNEEVK